MIPSTMQDVALTVRQMFDHGRRMHATSAVHTWDGERFASRSFADVADGVQRLAGALHRLGVRPGDRVATLCWNHDRHQEIYLAVPSMGAVLHTLNLRLTAEQLCWIVDHAQDRVLIIDASLCDLLKPVADRLRSLEHVIVVGGPPAAPFASALRYEDLVVAESAEAFAWPLIEDERAGATMCYTSGTTGDPKGVVYSHRSMFLQALAESSGNTFALSEHDRILAIVPMFHANAWGLPFAGWMMGCDLFLTREFLQAPHLARMIEVSQATFAGGVPTIWFDLLDHARDHDADYSSIRLIQCGGSAVPQVLIERMRDEHGVQLVQGWGMTETSPLAAISLPPRDVAPEDEMRFRTRSGRAIAGVEIRVVDDDGAELPWDGASIGEIQTRGPWVTGSYYRDESGERFSDGWLRTGDVGFIDDRGYVQLTDRAKDVIKSGGEWISSVELENHLMGHPDVLEACVIGVGDPRWQERPLACVVARPGTAPTPDELRAHLEPLVARWWLPERWAFIDEVPKTSVGKFDKKVLRARHAAGELQAAPLSTMEA